MSITLDRIKVPKITNQGVATEMDSGKQVTHTDRVTVKSSDVAPKVPLRNEAPPVSPYASPASQGVIEKDTALRRDILGDDASDGTPPPKNDDETTEKNDDNVMEDLEPHFDNGAAQINTLGGGRVSQTSRIGTARHGS